MRRFLFAMRLTRTPRPSLRPFIRMMWVADSRDSAGESYQRVLPTGTMSLAIRLDRQPFRIMAPGADRAKDVTTCEIIGGARSSAYVRRIDPGRSIGVQFEPAAAGLLFGVPAWELAERHTPLEDLWGDESVMLRQELETLEDPARQLDRMEAFLSLRLPKVRGIDPAIAHAVSRFHQMAPVRLVVGELGFAHRRFIERFREAIGMTPKRFCRVQRLAAVLELSTQGRGTSLADLALEGGYSDQPHFNREFRELAGMTPGEYRKIAPVAAHHVPLSGFPGLDNFVQD